MLLSHCIVLGAYRSTLLCLMHIGFWLRCVFSLMEDFPHWSPAGSAGAFITLATHSFSQITLLLFLQVWLKNFNTSINASEATVGGLFVLPLFPNSLSLWNRISHYNICIVCIRPPFVLHANMEMIYQVFLDLLVWKVELVLHGCGDEWRLRWKPLQSVRDWACVSSELVMAACPLTGRYF